MIYRNSIDFSLIFFLCYDIFFALLQEEKEKERKGEKQTPNIQSK